MLISLGSKSVHSHWSIVHRKMGRGYKDLIVWQKAKIFCVNIYKLTDEFPKSELFGLTSQLRRAAVSIPSNIAEGSKRNTQKDSNQFYAIAYGSGAELETQLEISKELFSNLKEKIVILDALTDEMGRLKRLGNLKSEEDEHLKIK